MASLNIAEARARMCLRVFLPCFVLRLEKKPSRNIGRVVLYREIGEVTLQMLSPHLLESANRGGRHPGALPSRLAVGQVLSFSEIDHAHILLVRLAGVARSQEVIAFCRRGLQLRE